MTKKEITKKVALELDMKQTDILKVIDKTFETIVESLSSGDEVLISKFGKFRIKKVSSKIRRNPKTGEEVIVPEGYKISFKISDILKEYINNL